MKSTLLWALIALNAVLLLSFLDRVSKDNTAAAQPAGGNGGNMPGASRRPGDYLMIPGEVTGGPTGLVYIIDTSNGLLGAMTYDDSSQKLFAMPFIDLQKQFDAASRASEPRNGRAR